MEASPKTTGLSPIADNIYFVLSAYSFGFLLGCHEKHRLYQRKEAICSMDTSGCIWAHNIFIFISVITCSGVRKQRNGRGDWSTDVITGEDFANMIAKVQLEVFVA